MSLRGPIPSDFIAGQSDIIFQSIDWKTCDINDEEQVNGEDEEEEDFGDEDEEEDMDDEEGKYKKKKYKNNKKLLIKVYGVTNTGNSVCVHIHGFEPFFYFKIPQEWEQVHFNFFLNTVKGMVEDYNRNGLIGSEIIMKKEFYGFTNNQLFKYGLFKFKNQASYYSYLRVLKEKTIILKSTRLNMNLELDMSDKLYEIKVTSLLRFFHVKNLDPAGWIIIKGGTYNWNTGKNKVTRCQMDISTHFQCCEKYECDEIAKILTASFDIECCSEDGSFPKYDRPYDRVIQIGTTVYEYGSSECKCKYIATLNDCLPIEGAIVECYNTERDLILGWARFMANLDADVITGYNIWGFDWEFIYRRAEKGYTNDGRPSVPFHNQLYYMLQRIKPQNIYKDKDGEDRNVKLTEQNLSSSAMGDNHLKFIDIEGVVQIDLLKYLQRETKMDSYKLDNVSQEILKQNKEDLTPNQLFANFRIGTPEKIQEIAIYCIKDCQLVNNLIDNLEVITNNLGMANVCVVPFSFIFLRGQGIKIFSLVAKFCRAEEFLIRELTDKDKDDSSYEGAIVFTPKPGIYFDPVVVMDYNSLYPSSMIAENISHDSILGYQEFRIKPGCSGNDKSDYEMIKDTIVYEYFNLPGYHYIDIEYDVFEGVDKEKRKVGYKVCRFAESDSMEKSVLPRILNKLLKARKDTRTKMKYTTFIMKDGKTYEGIPKDAGDDCPTIEISNVVKGKVVINKEDIESKRKTYNKFQLSVLESLQLAYKVTCNSLYGQVGAKTSPICYKELAACTTATGRNMVVRARDFTLASFPGSKLVYGDSVSGDTPLLLKNSENEIFVKNIKDLNNEWIAYEEFKPYDTNRRDKQQTTFNAQIWTSSGWADINRVIRHKTQKKMYRVLTHTGCVDVTEDHSLLDENLNKLKPKDVNVGMKLRHYYPYEYNFEFDGLNDKMTTKLYDLRKDSKEEIQREYMLLRRDGYFVNFEKTENKDTLQMSYSKNLFYNIKDENKIISIDELESVDYNEYVYDIETTDGTFQAGVGQMIVKNTDSVFINFVDHIKMMNPGKEFTEREMLEASFEMGEAAAANINSRNKKPQNIEYEKTLWPFCIFSKKRYFGNLYEHDPDDYKPKYMGIVLKRRDNAPVVKTIYWGVLDIILNQRNVELAKKYFRDSIDNLLKGKVDITQLVISKTLKAEYANPNQIAHKVLADRMGERDPGNKPQSNDRIPYCYIESINLKCYICEKNVNPENCKCNTCCRILCATHLVRHKDKCIQTCRFCKCIAPTPLKKCNTCTASYCKKCFEKHLKRTDKEKVVHMDKCKKPLTHKILQGDIIENPQYAVENKLKIDYTYYLEHQIQVPVFQIFALVMDKPESIIADIVRKNTNARKGNHSITDWLTKLGTKKQEVVKVEEVKVEYDESEEVVEIVETTNDTSVPERVKLKKLDIKPIFDITNSVNVETVDEEDEHNLMKDILGEEEEENEIDRLDEEVGAFQVDA